ncbi:activator of 90 kDa heat shock protein ATPase homolog 1 [Cimex lectularius]|uniref:Activator of Hsp90 ATPase AHSA1-like N-terminal domain-containing protein n=1 Tax=Cimex lectularius TaxID=79782 RepID=A0A8I6TF34_CIMLE|nr:activator of 90 kDa heat shock protein ATPase homolog 1 [Cimex lectularius]
MARWGEGDPRWIVEERPDATNVNNWHWTEKNACSWSQDKLKELLLNLKIESDLALCTVTEMDRIEGEAVANNRKGKLIFFYEWDMTLTWKGRLKGGTKECEGKIQIPNLSEENDISEVEVTFTLKESSDEGDVLKEFLRHQGQEVVREKLKAYVASLKEEFSKGMILPKKGSEDEHKEQMTILSSGFSAKMQMNNIQSSINNKIKTNTKELKNLKDTQVFQCTGEDFYRAMTTPEMVCAFTNGPSVVEARNGGKFSLFGGNIYGEFLELVPNKKIVQKWRLKSWPDDHFSTVTLIIDQQEDHTVVKVNQAGIPQSDVERTKENWTRYYWDAIKRTFGWGYFM